MVDWWQRFLVWWSGGAWPVVSAPLADPLADWRTLAARWQTPLPASMLSMLGGLYHDRRPGRGMDYRESRPYEFGDDPRFLDSRASARLGRWYVRSFEEERSQTVWIVFDGSQAMSLGEPGATKRDAAMAVALMLAAVALHAGDRVGMCWFQKDLCMRIPPKNHRNHWAALATYCALWQHLAATPELPPGWAEPWLALVPTAPLASWADLPRALQPWQRGSFIVVFSGFEAFIHASPKDTTHGSGSVDPLGVWRMVAQHHELLGIRVTDPREWALAEVGRVAFHGFEPERGRWVQQWVASHQRSARQAYAAQAHASFLHFQEISHKIGMIGFELATTMDPLRFWRCALQHLAWSAPSASPRSAPP